MAQIFATGNVSIFLKVYEESYARFLGHGEAAPVIDVTPAYVPFKSDSGGEIPVELLYAGKSARVSVDLNRFDMNVLDRNRDRARGRNFPSGDAGYDDGGQIGTPMITNGCTSELFLVFDFAGKVAYSNPANGSLPPGYHFLASLLDPERCVFGTTNAHKVHLEWQCVRKRVPIGTGVNPFGRTGYKLYDFDISATNGVAMS